jgi:single-strand DNA-binding protein
MNVTMLRGRLSRPPEERTLPSGDRLVAYDLTVPHPGDRADSVPLVWPDPPARALAFDAGDEVVVTGRVRRRFFRAGGLTQSRTEVVVDAVVPARQAKRAESLLGKARDRSLEPEAPLVDASGEGG